MPTVRRLGIFVLMGDSIDGGDSGAADTPRQSLTERLDAGLHDWSSVSMEPPEVVQDRVRRQAEEAEPLPPLTEPRSILDMQSPEPGSAPKPDVSRDLKPTVELQELSDLSEIGRQSVTDSVNGFVEFATRRAISVVADLMAPVTGGRIVDLAFEIYDLMTTVRALGSDDPVLEAPLPSAVAGFDFTLEIPLAIGERTDPPLALCIAPDTPSLTGGWALDAPEQDKRPGSGSESGRGPEHLPDAAEEEELERELERRRAASRSTTDKRQPELRAVNRSVVGCIVETDFGSLPLLMRRKLRACELSILAREYAPQLRQFFDLGYCEVLIIADQQRHCGLWIWLGPDSGDGLFAT